MGTFIGHVVPGSFFVLFGAWWTFQICRKYLKSFTKQGESFTCQVTYPPSCARCNVDVEAVIAVSAAVIGMLIELVFACSFRGMAYWSLQWTTCYNVFFLWPYWSDWTSNSVASQDVSQHWGHQICCSGNGIYSGSCSFQVPPHGQRHDGHNNSHFASVLSLWLHNNDTSRTEL